MIDITGVDLVKFAQKVYELSSPQGLGFMHFTPKPLEESVAKEIVTNCKKYGGNTVLDMDYVNGRACKMHVRDVDGKLQINDSWYDHTDDQLKSLLSAFDIMVEPSGDHGCACNCANCRIKQGQPA